MNSKFQSHLDAPRASTGIANGGEAIFYFALALLAIAVGVPAAIVTMLGAM